MNPNLYQEQAKTTAFESALSDAYLIPGLAGEFGEIQEGFLAADVDSYTSELGDHLWFLAILSDLHGYSFERIILEEERAKNLEEYQKIIDVAVKDDHPTREELTYELGVFIGDLCTIHAKAIRDNGGEIPKDKIIPFGLALSNTVYAVARLGSFHGITLAQMMEKNIKKLFDRKARGKIGGSGNNR